MILGPRFAAIPPVIRNLILINVLVFFVSSLAEPFMLQHFALFYVGSEYFAPHQFLTHMFMHGGIMHIFFNMFALWMFGKVLEQVWGSKRFLIYFLVTGLGAAALHTFVQWIEFSQVEKAILAFSNSPSPDAFAAVVRKYFGDQTGGMWYTALIDAWQQAPSSDQMALQAEAGLRKLLEMKMNVPTVGASGAVYGILLAFGMMFPNVQLMLLIPPIPIKAKYMVIAYGLIELSLGVMDKSSNVAHFAHLGGMIFGFFLIQYWRKHDYPHY